MKASVSQCWVGKIKLIEWMNGKSGGTGLTFTSREEKLLGKFQDKGFITMRQVLVLV